MGHVRSYSIADAHARYRRALGEPVLLAIGFDALGLPTEVEAIKRGTPPQEVARDFRIQMLGQFAKLGYSFDWNRSFVSSEEPAFGAAQRLFLLLHEKGHVYQGEATVDWCPNCQTVLARLQVETGKCWRCHEGTELVRRPQWFLRTSAYLREDDERLDGLTDWDKRSVGAQRSLLGRCAGVELEALIGGGPALTLFTPYEAASPMRPSWPSPLPIRNSANWHWMRPRPASFRGCAAAAGPARIAAQSESPWSRPPSTWPSPASRECCRWSYHLRSIRASVRPPFSASPATTRPTRRWQTEFRLRQD